MIPAGHAPAGQEAGRTEDLKRLRDALAERDALIAEVLRAGNANTRAVKELMRQAGAGWCQRARAALENKP